MATPASSPSLAQRVEVHGLTNALVIDATNKLLKTNSALKKLFDDGEITVKHIRKTMSTYLEVDESELKPFKAVIKDHVTELMAQEPEESVEPTADSDPAPEPAPEPAPAPKQKKPRAKKVAAQRTLAPEFNDTELSQKSKPLSGPPTAGDSSDEDEIEEYPEEEEAPRKKPKAAARKPPPEEEEEEEAPRKKPKAAARKPAAGRSASPRPTATDERRGRAPAAPRGDLRVTPDLAARRAPHHAGPPRESVAGEVSGPAGAGRTGFPAIRRSRQRSIRPRHPRRRKQDALKPSNGWTEAALGAATAALQEAVDGGDGDAIVAKLRTLAAKPLSYELLTSTGVGKLVGRLRFHGAEAVKAPAGELVRAWKDMILATR
jgi:hypothetical protein